MEGLTYLEPERMSEPGKSVQLQPESMQASISGLYDNGAVEIKKNSVHSLRWAPTATCWGAAES